MTAKPMIESNPILLVEDDLSLCGSLCQFLQDNGYRTISAHTARQGWELIRSRQPRLCLLDLNLPDGSGLDLLHNITHHNLRVRVVVMTAFDLHHLRPLDCQRCLAGWMTKPVNPLELLAMVEQVMCPDEVVAGHQKPGA